MSLEIITILKSESQPTNVQSPVSSQVDGLDGIGLDWIQRCWISTWMFLFMVFVYHHVTWRLQFDKRILMRTSTSFCEMSVKAHKRVSKYIFSP